MRRNSHRAARSSQCRLRKASERSANSVSGMALVNDSPTSELRTQTILAVYATLSGTLIRKNSDGHNVSLGMPMRAPVSEMSRIVQSNLFLPNENLFPSTVSACDVWGAAADRPVHSGLG